ncbi:hypothetical protein HPP92_023292 [Vanilla planifolia]|uniref:Uncharacterized protein n=1 Tax=Vanilla planifolia TaxID=51239 RepID=A0A835PQ36_VANPL|nr:hypothetical protein HPP92_023292 [Vanilla planifolia]
MEARNHGFSSSPETSVRELDFQSMQQESTPQLVSPASNCFVSLPTVNPLPSPSERNPSSKLTLPSPPGRRERMAQIRRPWTSTIYDFGQHNASAIMTVLFPCATFGHIVEIVDEGKTSCICASCVYFLLAPALCSCWILGSTYRRKLRSKYNLVEAPAEDWVLHLFCPFCSLCQEFRELKNRGIDPSIGWMGHLAKQHQGTLARPPPSQVMD